MSKVTDVEVSTFSECFLFIIDFVVGAPKSDSVALLQTRLIVNANLTLNGRPNPVDPRFRNACPQNVDSLGFRVSGCFFVDFILSYNFMEKNVQSAYDRLGMTRYFFQYFNKCLVPSMLVTLVVFLTLVDQKNEIVFHPPRLGTPPKLEALTVYMRCSYIAY